jgi:N-acetylglucosamine kinase-like BadF-type ATPase
MTGRAYLLGIDGGQTSTKSLLATIDGEVIAAGRGGPSDHFHIEGGVEKNRRAIHGVIASALDTAGVASSAVAAIGLGLTGAPTGGDQNPVIDEIVREKLPHLDADRIVIQPDYKTNLGGASGGKPGVVLIAGGGCIAYGITGDGREAISGGFGYLIGDEGSAFDIGLRAIEAACKASDFRGPGTVLEAVVLDHFSLPKMRTITRVVYRAGFSREEISLLTPKVVAAAEEGDGEAVRILRKCAGELAATASGVIRQLYEPGQHAAVYLTGGVFEAGALITEPFTGALRAHWTEAEPLLPRFPPVVGALIEAARAAGGEPDERWLQRVEETLPDVLP